MDQLEPLYQVVTMLPFSLPQFEAQLPRQETASLLFDRRFQVASADARAQQGKWITFKSLTLLGQSR